jgi:hypothetical protein
VIGRDEVAAAAVLIPTTAAAQASFTVNLGTWVVKPYCYKLTNPQNSAFLRNWRLQARLDDDEWVTLSEHVEDQCFTRDHQTNMFPLFIMDPSQVNRMFNIFRIELTGPNADEKMDLIATGFEVYGQLARRDAADDLVLSIETAPGAVSGTTDEKEAIPTKAVAVAKVVSNPQWFTDLYEISKVLAFFSCTDDNKGSLLPQRYVDLMGDSTALSRSTWGELCSTMNIWSLKHNNASPDAEQIDASAFNVDQKTMKRAMDSLVLLNSQVSASLGFFDLQAPPKRSSLVDGLRESCDLIFYCNKSARWSAALTATERPVTAQPTIHVNPMQAAAFQESGLVDGQANQLFWGQAFTQLRQSSASTYRIPFGARAFRCDYEGVSSIDAGGPYRDVLERMSVYLVHPAAGLFCRTANQISGLGENRDCFVPSPSATSHLQLEQFEFLGKLMGLSLRTRDLFNVHLPSMVWKALLGQPLTLDDIQGVDVLSANILRDLLADDKKNTPVELYNTEMQWCKFSAMCADGVVRPLCPDGETKSLTYENRHEYASLLLTFRLNEFKVQTAAIRRGLGKVIPLNSLGLFSWRELETMVCGLAFGTDSVALLKSETVYNSCSPTDQHIVWFWDILENDFTNEQRALYLTFVWGRSRLPSTAAEFSSKHHIACRGGGSDAFPLAHTCFFTLDLPIYTDRAVMAQRLATAISMCGAIDAD